MERINNINFIFVGEMYIYLYLNNKNPYIYIYIYLPKVHVFDAPFNIFLTIEFHLKKWTGAQYKIQEIEK